MKKLLFLSIVFIGLFFCPSSFVNAQGVGINSSGNPPDASAILDVSSTTRGFALPRMTTVHRNAISSPLEGLQIFNTTTKCLEIYAYGLWQSIFCAACPIPTAVTASANPTILCAGNTLTLTGMATGATVWSWTGPNGFTSTLQNSTISNVTTAASGVYSLTASNTCGSATVVNTASVIVNMVPTGVTASAFPATLCAGNTLTLTSSATGASSWSWTGPNNFSSSLQNTSISNIVTAASGVYTLTASSSCGSASAVNSNSVTINPWTCGCNLTVNHNAGTVAPVTKTVNYGTVLTGISGASKCWITQNLGADQQASSVTDATEPSAGWYWQFNRMQGYKHDGTNRTPNTTWITTINENSDWQITNNPCYLLLGTGWRLPTNSEWTNVDGPPQNWNNYNDAFNSVLKLHAAGYLDYNTGALSGTGFYGVYWSSTQADNTQGDRLDIESGASFESYYGKQTGFSVRCLKD